MKGRKEIELLNLLKQGSSLAFKELYRQYAHRVFSFAKKYENNIQECEGIVQTVFLKLWENRSQLNADQSLKAYLFKLTKNILINRIKKNLHKNEYTTYLKNNPMLLQEPYHDINYRELTRIVEQIIDSMPERRRRIFLLSRNEGLTYKEIAEKLNITENTVDTQVRNALNYLREQLKRIYSTKKAHCS